MTKLVFIGGMNLDIQSIPDDRTIPGDSLIGKIMMSPGGVVRNIAENCSLLGLDSSLVSVIGDDSAGETILRETVSSGVNTEHCIILEGERTSCYSAFLDAKGEMHYAVNDMSIMEKLSPGFFMERRDILDAADFLVLDTNIPEQTIQFLCRSFQEKILLIDPVSTGKIMKLKNRLHRVRIFKPNVVEAEYFTGMPLNNESDFYKAMDHFIYEGVERIFISAGSRGIFYADSTCKGCAPSFPVDIKSVTGAGDAASAALVLSSILDLDIIESAILANLTAASSLMSSETINKDLSLLYLENLYKEFVYEPKIS